MSTEHETRDEHETRVTVLTQPDCRLCEQAKAVLGRVGAEHHLDVDEIRLDSPTGQDLATRHGVMFAPGVLLDGTLFSYGRLSERRLRRHLSRLPPTPPAAGSPQR